MNEPIHKEYARLRRRPFLTPVWLTVIGAAILLVIAAWGLLSASTTMVYVIRHAETVAGSGDDADLSLAGRLRAERLREVFAQPPGALGLTGIIVSQHRRSQQTAQPLANALGVPMVVVRDGDPSAVAHRVLSDFRGGRVLVVGSETSVAAIVKALSGRDVPAPDASDYGSAYIVARPRFSPAAVSLLRLP